MNITLTSELEIWIAERVRSGAYGTRSELVREALQQLREHEQGERARLAELRASLEESEADIAAGRLHTLDEGFISGVETRGRARLNGGNTIEIA